MCKRRKNIKDKGVVGEFPQGICASSRDKLKESTVVKRGGKQKFSCAASNLVGT